MDDTARKASGGVRNLRAMFENRDNSEESTPSPQPNRGRSGAPDSARATQSPMTSKLNKVQTNFIAVDKPSKSGTLWGMKNNNTTSNNNNDQSSSNTPTPTDTTTSSTTTPLKNETTAITSENSNIKKPTEDSSIDKKEKTSQDTSISPPAESTMPRRRDSFSLHDDLPADHKTIQARKASIAEEFRNRAQSIQIGALDSPIPEFAVETPALETPAVDGNRARHQLGYSEPPVPRTTANPDKATNDNQPGVHMNPADPKDGSAVTEGKSLQGGSIRGLTGGDAKSMREAAVQGLKATPAKATLAMRGISSPAANSPTAAPSNGKQPLRSPPLQKTPVSAAASQRQAATGSRNVSNVSNVSAASTTSTAKPASKPTTTNGPPKPITSSTARSSATGPTSSQAAKKIPSGASASGTGFHKPKPKSPTRPAKLPASLMAPTASSISKVAGAENNNTTIQRRRESHGSLAQNKTAAQSKLKGETLKHTTSHSRPSVGPPPSSAAHKKPTTSATKPAGDSFLERMMRPTAASANKAVGHHDEKPNPPPPKPKAAHPATTPHTSRPVTREKVHAEKETPQVGPSKVEKEHEEQKKGEMREPSFERPHLIEKISEPVSPKTEAPPKIESKEDAIKTEVPKTFQEPHIEPPSEHHEPQPQFKHEPHVDPPKASTPSGKPLPSHSIPKVHKTERTVSITDMENSDGTIKKLKPGEIPIPKIAKKKKPQPVAVEENKKVQSPPRSPKPDITEIPKEKKRDFLLEVREEEKRHRRMSERPSMVKNPTSIPEVAEPEDEEVDDHQLPSGGSGDDADRSGSSMDIPRTVPKKSPSPKKSLSPTKPLSPSKEKTPTQTSQHSHRGSLEENAFESQLMDEEDVDQTDIVESQAPPPRDKVARRLSTTAEKAMDYAAEAVDQAAAAVDEALKHKVSTTEKAKEADEVEAEAVQGLSKGHPLTSAMLNGSALDTDDEYTPTPSEKTNPFDNAALGIDGGKDGVKEKEGGEHAEKKPRRQSNAGDFAIAPTMKAGEEVIAKDRQDAGGESKLPIDDETAKEGEEDDKVGDKDVTALAS